MCIVISLPELLSVLNAAITDGSTVYSGLFRMKTDVMRSRYDGHLAVNVLETIDTHVTIDSGSIV